MKGLVGGFNKFLAVKRGEIPEEDEPLYVIGSGCEIENDEIMPTECEFRGEEIRRELCNSCKGKVEVKVFACTRHGECTAAKKIADVHVCDCKTTTAPRPAMSDEEYENLVIQTVETIRGPSQQWPQNWEFLPQVVEAHSRLLRDFVSTKQDPPDFGSDRGIITLGGGTKYFVCAYALIHQLRQLGCALPVQLYYLGREELDHAMELLIVGLGNAECIDLLSIVGNQPRRMGGWEAKIWAIMCCPFREVLFLDADNNPVSDPTYLFKCQEFRETGAVLWPDLPNKFGYDITTEAFQVAGLPVPGRNNLPGHDKPTDYRPVESGQLLFDKSRVWHALNTVRHLCDHSDFWFREPRGKRRWYIYGDKSTFYLAFEATKTPYAMPRDCEWFGLPKGGGFRQYDFNGQPVLEHRCQPPSKIQRGVDPIVDGMTHGNLLLDACRELRKAWRGVPWSWQHQDVSDNDIAREMLGNWMTYGLPLPEQIELLDQGAIRHATDHHWRILHHDGKPVLVVANAGRAVAFLGPDEKSNWVNHDRQQFMSPAPPESFDMRRERFEIGLWSDITRRNEYRLPTRFEAGSTIVDVGAHVGIFARECLERGAEHVICIEPNHENFSRLVRNMHPYGRRATLINAACWRSDAPAGWLRLAHKPGAEHSGGGSVIDTDDGQLCRTIGLDEVRGLVSGCIRLLKIDCEGAEWPILFTSDLADVIELCGEWHLNGVNKAAPTWRLPQLDESPDPLENPEYYLERLWGRLNDAGFASIEMQTNVPGLGWMFARR